MPKKTAFFIEPLKRDVRRHRGLHETAVRVALEGNVTLERSGLNGKLHHVVKFLFHHLQISISNAVSRIIHYVLDDRLVLIEVLDVGCDLGGWKGRRSETVHMRLSPEPAKSADSVERLDSRLPLSAAEVERAVRQEMACTLEDVLARRSRCLFLDARAAQEVAPSVSRSMRVLLGKSEEWERDQLRRFAEAASLYLP